MKAEVIAWTLEALKDRESVTRKEIADGTGFPPVSVGRVLVFASMIVPVGRGTCSRWTLPERADSVRAQLARQAEERKKARDVAAAKRYRESLETKPVDEVDSWPMKRRWIQADAEPRPETVAPTSVFDLGAK